MTMTEFSITWGCWSLFMLLLVRSLISRPNYAVSQKCSGVRLSLSPDPRIESSRRSGISSAWRGILTSASRVETRPTHRTFSRRMFMRVNNPAALTNRKKHTPVKWLVINGGIK